jgi:DNA polymerase-3 subunit delta
VTAHPSQPGSASAGSAGAGVPPLVLISGPEQVLADRALASTMTLLRDSDPEVEVIKLYAASYEPGSLAVHTSPSLFGGSRVVVVHDLDEASDELQTDVLALLAAPADDVTLVLAHKGGNRGKKVLDTAKKAHARVIDCPAIKTDRDKTGFVTNEFRSKRRKITPEAIRALLEAVGKDVSELTAACAQLIADTEGLVDDAVVERYHGGKVDASGFRVADAAIAGQAGEALRLLRHAIASGVDPVPIVAVLASQLRQVVKVGSASRGLRSAEVAKQLGMAPWQVDRARQTARGWDPQALGRSIQAVAAADFDVKGGGRDPVYAVERAILTIATERQGRTA